MPLCGFHWHSGVVHSFRIILQCLLSDSGIWHREFLWPVEVNGYFIGYLLVCEPYSKDLSNCEYFKPYYVNVTVDAFL